MAKITITATFDESDEPLDEEKLFDDLMMAGLEDIDMKWAD